MKKDYYNPKEDWKCYVIPKTAPLIKNLEIYTPAWLIKIFKGK